jgi:hypothetical protein
VCVAFCKNDEKGKKSKKGEKRERIGRRKL